MIKGIDVSEHQGYINWNQVKPQIDFAMIRAGYGKNNIDKSFIHNITECNRLNIPCGVYWFSYALSAEMAKNEAIFCFEAIKHHRINMPVAFDFEYDSALYATKKGIAVTKDLVSDMITEFCSSIEGYGYWTSIYTNVDYQQRYINPVLLNRYDLWLASWYNNPDFTKPPKPCGIWQHGCRYYRGIYGQVDSNIAYKDYLNLIKEVKYESKID